MVSDVAGALHEGVSRYLNDFVPPLIKILRDQDQDRNSKLQAIVALGDLAMNSGEAFNFYLADVLKILESASQQSLILPSQVGDDQDLADYLVQLRDILVETYTTIVHGVTQAHTKQSLVQAAPSILGFLERLVQYQGSKVSINQEDSFSEFSRRPT